MKSVPLVLALAFVALAVPASADVENTAHDLVAHGLQRDGTTQSRCSFCHAPHTSAPKRPLWGGTMPAVTYKLYESSTLNATVDQPTGASRVCLSCHDGTIAASERPWRFGGATPTGTSLGTDLSDDHPISFTYDSRLAAVNGDVVEPSMLPSTTRLDQTKQLQCTTCHDPHESRTPKFLVTDNRGSRLCVTCHQLKGWASSSHATSAAAWNGKGQNPWGTAAFQTVAENGCANCHRVHSAGRPQWLLQSGTEARNCLNCHSGTTAVKDVEREFRKISSHPIDRPEWIHTPGEDPRLMPRHVSCSDCHDPHGARRTAGAAGSFNSAPGVKGITTSGGVVAQANAEYELCYACHGLREPVRATFVRRENVANTRLEFDPGNASYHPVVAPGRNPNVAGFEPGYSASTTILCSDCHNSDSRSGANGPHGSIYEPILEREYDLRDPAPESYRAYSLCYKCHSRSAVLSDRGGFPHRKHVVDLQAACSTCHDAHGSRTNPSLINFAVRGRTGATLVSPSNRGRLEFQSLGPSQGQCFLSCHGADHDPQRYGAAAVRTDAFR